MATYPNLTWEALEQARALAERVEKLSRNLSEEAEKLSKTLCESGREDDARRTDEETS